MPTSVVSEVASDDFRQAMRELAGAISVVTVADAQERTGFVATSVSSLSTNPPRLIVCIGRTSSSWRSLTRVRFFGVNFLRESDSQIASRFAGFNGVKGSDRYLGAEWITLPSGVLVLENALASLECVVEEFLDRYDHSIILGRIQSIRLRDANDPLLWFKSQYHRLGDSV
jgi:flavin reductase (DIM6/NTAB) family NADH-FMN oxidoreductase RutF